MGIAVPVRTQIVNSWLHKGLNPDDKTDVIVGGWTVGSRLRTGVSCRDGLSGDN